MSCPITCRLLIPPWLGLLRQRELGCVDLVGDAKANPHPGPAVTGHAAMPDRSAGLGGGR